MKKQSLFVLFSGAWVLANGHDINFTIHNTGNQNDKVVYLFAHGLRSTKDQALRLAQPKEAPWVLGAPLVSFNFPDSKSEEAYRRKQVNLAQEKDLEAFHQAYLEVKKQFPDHKIVLAGISRGAATVVNYLGLYKPDDVHMAIVESSFDTLSSVFVHLLRRFKMHWVPFSKNVASTIATTHFPGISLDGPFPLHAIKDIPKHIPIIFVHSKRDDVVPITSSRRLYIQLKMTGHEHVHLLELQSGQHARVLNGPDGKTYQYIIHALYQKYDLPHDPHTAAQGLRFFEIATPSIKEVAYRLKKKRSTQAEDLGLIDIDKEDFDLDRVLAQFK